MKLTDHIPEMDPRAGIAEHGSFCAFGRRIGIGSRRFTRFKRGATFTEQYTGWYVFLVRDTRAWRRPTMHALMLWRGKRHRHRDITDYGGFGQGFAAAEAAMLPRHQPLPDRDR
jgi:hypothetical protein